MICRQCGLKLGLMERWRHGQFCSKACKTTFEQEDVKLAIQALSPALRPAPTSGRNGESSKEAPQADPPEAGFLKQVDPSYEDQPAHAPLAKQQHRPKKRDAILVPDHRFGSPSPQEPKRLASALWIDLSGVPEDAAFGCLFPPKVPVYTPERKSAETTLRLALGGVVVPEQSDASVTTGKIRPTEPEALDWNEPVHLPSADYSSVAGVRPNERLMTIEEAEPNPSPEIAEMIPSPDTEVEWGNAAEIPVFACKPVASELPPGKGPRREIPVALNRWIQANAATPEAIAPAVAPIPTVGQPFLQGMPQAPQSLPPTAGMFIAPGAVPFASVPYAMVTSAPYSVPFPPGVSYGGYPALAFIPPKAGHVIVAEIPESVPTPMRVDATSEPFPAYLAPAAMPNESQTALTECGVLELDATSLNPEVAIRKLEVDPVPSALDSMLPYRAASIGRPCLDPDRDQDLIRPAAPNETQTTLMEPGVELGAGVDTEIPIRNPEIAFVPLVAELMLPRLAASIRKPGFQARPHRNSIRLRWVEPESLRIPPKAGDSS